MKKLAAAAIVLIAALVAWLALRGEKRPATTPPESPPPAANPLVQRPPPKPPDRVPRAQPTPVEAATPAAAESKEAASNEPFVGLSALVLDADGRACSGVEVALVRRTVAGDVLMSWRATTDAEGVARVGDLAKLLKGGGPVRDDAPAWLTVDLPTSGRPVVAVDARTPVDAPIRLVLPPTGRIRCEIVAAPGASSVEGECVRLDAPGANSNRFRWNPEEEREAGAPVIGGVALFEHVGLGRQWEAILAPIGEPRTRVAFAGPRSAGETVVVRLEAGERPVVVAGRLLDRDGMPVADLFMRAKIVAPDEQDAPRPTWIWSTSTHADERFEFQLNCGPKEASGATLELFDDDIWGRWRRTIARVDLRAVPPSGETDVGDVRWDGLAPRLLASGVVVDPSGAAIHDARIETLDPGVSIHGNRTEFGGRFDIRGDSTAATFRVVAIQDGCFLAAPVSVPTGAKDARVVMSLAGGLAGSVKLPPGDPREFRVFVSGEAAQVCDRVWRDADGSLWGVADDDGTFEFKSLRPGTARVEVRRARGTTPLVVVEGVEIVAGRTTRDPRLVGLNPTAGARVVRVTATDPEGRPIENAQIHWRPAGGRGVWVEDRTTDLTGHASVVVYPPEAKDGRIDVVVTRRGRRAAEASDVQGEGAVVLTPAARPAKATLRLADSSPTTPEPWRLGATLRWADGDDEAADPRDVAGPGGGFGARRTASFPACPPGSYRVELRVWNRDTGEGGPVKTASPTIVVVGEDGAPVEAVVAVDPDDLRRATSGR